MANPEHVALVRKGSAEIAKWRAQHDDARLDLTGADLSQLSLIEADLRKADLGGAKLVRTRLIEANLIGADLGAAKLGRASLTRADLRFANLTGASLLLADLSGANLSWAELRGAELAEAHLIDANLHGTHLAWAHLNGSRLSGADLTGAGLNRTIFAFLDLRGIIGLDAVLHVGPSSIGIETVYLSKGEIPEVFLRGAGVPDSFITFAKSLVGKPFDFYSCFISHSTIDQEFAERLYADLQAKGVRCWYAPEDLKIGDKFRTRIDEAIRIHDKLLIILSENSVRSAWVESEVEAAFERERRENRTVLFPIRIDDAVMQTDAAWAADIRRTRHIGDFRNWKNHDAFQKAFERLLRDLKAEDEHAKT
jgi:uncharacterized protein YjbI with pentapeptide repeats